MGHYSKVLSEQQLAAALAVSDSTWKVALFRGATPPHSGLSTDPKSLMAAVSACAEARPERFAELLTSLSAGTKPSVMHAILVGLASSRERLSRGLLIRLAS